MVHLPRKSLGQHFLHQKSVIRDILRFFNAQSEDILVEIGPGQGALTFELLQQVKKLHVIELDKTLADGLKVFELPNLEVHHADALKVDYCALETGRRIRIIGNLPYNISTPMLFKLLSHHCCVIDVCVMLQREVGERILAKPGGKQYGRLSVMLQQRCELQRVLRVAPGAFSPPPKVDSMVIYLRPFDNPPHPVSNPRAFEQVVRLAFSNRRKTIRNAWKSILTTEEIARAGVDPGLRPEQLEVGEYVRISQLLPETEAAALN